MRILIVEDDPLIAMSLTWELEHAGHEVIGPAFTVESAVPLARIHLVELALLDIDLQQRGEGIELARRMRQMDIPTLFVSAQSHAAHEHSALAMGYISKPYNPADIAGSIDVIDAMVHGRKPSPPVPASLELFH